MEFVRILGEEDFPDQNFFDVCPSLKRIRIQGTCLEVEELFNLQRSLSTIHLIVTFLRRCQDEPSQARSEGLYTTGGKEEIPIYPYLYALTQDVKTYPLMVKRIDQILDKFGHVKDTASPALLQIRRELASIEPAEVVEANNKIRELESEERKEIHRILLSPTSSCSG